MFCISPGHALSISRTRCFERRSPPLPLAHYRHTSDLVVLQEAGGDGDARSWRLQLAGDPRAHLRTRQDVGVLNGVLRQRPCGETRFFCYCFLRIFSFVHAVFSAVVVNGKS